MCFMCHSRVSGIQTIYTLYANYKKIIANEIINSLGYPTLQGKLFLDDNRFIISNISSLDPEANISVKELRDNDKSRYNGLGCIKSCFLYQ